MTKQADYGIVLLTRMAREEGRRFAAPELAEETHLPLPTVSKILKILSRSGLLHSTRGVKGGYSLARAAVGINVADMIEALEGPIAFTECIEDSPGSCSQEASCTIRGNWQRINEAVRGALERITLSDLTAPISPRLVQIASSLARSNSSDTAQTSR
ncbi:MAG: SUF system Fe-S cluster assembly regulator [Thermoanaerobaculia bacterium]|nr:SUF system Fe-S cluster assembly regulator [Thermoanaerobaculia bacterium]